VYPDPSGTLKLGERGQGAMANGPGPRLSGQTGYLFDRAPRRSPRPIGTPPLLGAYLEETKRFGLELTTGVVRRIVEELTLYHPYIDWAVLRPLAAPERVTSVTVALSDATISLQAHRAERQLPPWTLTTHTDARRLPAVPPPN
jgi:hypothetical protein